MTGRDEVPTTAEVRERFIDGFPFWAVARATLGDEFDRWLSAHDEAVRQEEREKAAQIADSYAIEVNNRAISDDLAAWASAMGKYRGAQEAAARIREQRKEQGS